MQQTQIIGRIGKDAETKEVNGQKVSNFSVAVSEKWKDKSGQMQEKTTWYECAKWGDSGVVKYLTKGTQVYVSGNVTADAYTDKQGEVKGVLRLNAFIIELLGGGEAKSNGASSVSDAEVVGPESDNNPLPF